jgi:hypothetical protein
MYPSPKSISVHDAIVVTCFGKIFIKMETTEPQQNASAIPVKNLKTKFKIFDERTQIQSKFWSPNLGLYNINLPLNNDQLTITATNFGCRG